MSFCDIHKYIQPGCRAHLVGIGGVSMAPLAEVLQGAGVIVSGSDWNESAKVAHLRSLGIQVFTGGQKAENIEGADCVIRTAAAHDDNPEIAAARSKRCPVIPAAPALGCKGDSRSTASSGMALIRDLSCLWVVAHQHDVLN